MRQRQPNARQMAARIWLITDARNDASLDHAIANLPCDSGVVFRHYHLPARARRARFDAVRRLCRKHGHALVLAGSPALARRWGADGNYGAPLRGRTIATAHDLAEIGRANRLGAAALMLSPVYPTRSHPDARPLGPVRFRLLAGRSRVPVIALGGMTARGARRLTGDGWAAIDAFAPH